MNDGVHTERSALPLKEAAARLGLSAEVLRLRLERGEAHGFERNGETFVYIKDSLAERRFAGSAADAPASTAEAPVEGALPVVVEFQKMELNRLLRENERLNARLDQLMEEIRHLRDMQQREQVLRQQEQSLRQQIQDTLDHLADRLALPPPRPPAAEAPSYLAASGKPGPRGARTEPPELVLTRTVVPKAKDPESKAPDSGVPASRTAEAKTPAPKLAPGAHSGGGYLAKGRDGQRREPHAAMPKAAPDRPAKAPLAASAGPSNLPSNGAIAPEEAAELAGILKDIGQSLRDSEAFRRFPPVKPGRTPQRAGERRTSRPPQEGAGTAQPAQDRPAADALLSEEAAMLAILDSMGPTAEDRRAAAQRMRRLLRDHQPPR